MHKRLFSNVAEMSGDYTKLMEKAGENLLLASIRRGLILMIPVVLIGSLALLFSSFPVPQYQELMARLFGQNWQDFFIYVHDGTIGILSLAMVTCITYSLATELENRDKLRINPVIVSTVALCSFVALFGINKDGFKITNYGVTGVFVSILVAVVASLLFYKLSSIKLLRIRPFSDGDSITFSHAVASIIPAAITITLFAAVNQILAALLNITDINDFLADVLYHLFANISNSFLRALLFIFLIHFLWFFGIHGSNMLEHVAQSIYVPALAINQELIQAGGEPTQIFTKTFFDTFVLMGGCGSTLCLIIAVFMLKKNKNQRRIAKFSLFPLLFNINELIVFGFPLVLNPIYLIPFLLVPLLLTMTSYAAVSLGLVPFTIQTVEWTTPVFISGYYATGFWSGCLLQLFNLILGTLCYIPFVKLSQTVSVSRLKKSFEALCAEFKKSERSNKRHSLLERQDMLGSLAKALAEDLKYDIETKKLTLFYQPQVDYEGKVFCAEALLRWNHVHYGTIYPPLVIALAEEYHLIDELGLEIIDQACSTIKIMAALGFTEMAVSVNITASQLENQDFSGKLRQLIEKHQISPKALKIEITEQVALENNKWIKDTLNAIKEMGIELEMDDFGMGHSSLMYLKEYNFDTVKLDGSLVREISTNMNCRDIISSIIYLSRSMNYAVLAEFVETEEQRQILHELGCDLYQGYLYSPAIPLADLLAYIRGSQG
ncbi:EAL domain-containing protein [Desulfitobacterium chlororespirans]|uniref:Diguanylate phosphodiesterase n=1 Tax=Desulfitobacterium chlororespirans DSM 11544 TaxID=1121395 RepID=A0A1M7SDA8_9FIRM|nr:EAL domain-containing protein [Desulfitobacterium chlororespirans]SHN56496.1 diguanylate phosphodiesterase [Desulfitobacterium chlororespirans DSM 11544]